MAREIICGIYCIENIIDGKKYIGQSKNIYNRWYQHKLELNHNKHGNRYLQNAWNKYGENNFKFYIIEKCSEDELNEKEIYYINCFDSHAHFGKRNGYNLTTGGEGIGNLSEEERQVYREAQQSIPIYQINFDGNIVNKWEYGAREASKKLNIQQCSIWNCVNHKRKTYKNFIWVSVDEYNNGFDKNNYLNQNTQARKILQYDMFGNLVKIWDSANSISQYGYDCSSIIKVCKQKYKTYKNYLWCYDNDNYINEDFINDLHKKDYIKVYDSNKTYLGSFTSQVEISEKINISKSMISSYLKGTLKYAKGFHFEYSSVA